MKRRRPRIGTLFVEVAEWNGLKDSADLLDFCIHAKKAVYTLDEVLGFVIDRIPPTPFEKLEEVAAEFLPVITEAFSDLQNFYALLVAHMLVEKKK